jgi:hypothetical protein
MDLIGNLDAKTPIQDTMYIGSRDRGDVSISQATAKIARNQQKARIEDSPSASEGTDPVHTFIVNC